MGAIIILIKLICAHLCSDFLFQTDSINKGKHQSGITGIYYLSLHSLIHAATAYLFVAEWSCWLIPAAIFVGHFIIDLAKCKYLKDTVSTFIIDQLLHIVLIVILNDYPQVSPRII